jgi:uncharacterized protein (DUF1800 family)
MNRSIILASALLLFTGPASPGDSLSERQRAVHALNRLAFGPRPGEVDRVLKIGVDAWIDRQLAPERLDDRAVEKRLEVYDTLRKPAVEIVGEFREARETPGEMRMKSREILGQLMSQRILRAAESERQLSEVMVDFWMNHFNVFAAKGLDRALVTSYERDTIRPRIWGRFEDLLMATAKSPAMLVYLDNARSRAGGINENYAREIMELHTLGVDGGYTQKDVTELARVLTGWSIDRSGEFLFRRAMHDTGAKRVLGVTLRSGGGIEEGETMIRTLARHPSTARFIAYKLCQRLVADEPPSPLVDRVARRFLATRGDLRETVKAIAGSAEFWSPHVYGAKVKSPFEYAVSAIRAVGGRIDNPLPLARELQKLGEPLYLAQPPTGYAETAEAWVSSGALLNRINFAIALAENKMPGVTTGVRDPAATGLMLGGPEFQRQ